MKKQSLLLILSSLLIGGCTIPNFSSSDINDSNSANIPTSDSIKEESSSVDVSSDNTSSSDTIIEDSSSSGSITEPIVNQVKRVTDYLGSDNDVYRINITTQDEAFPLDKENYVNGSITVTEQDTNKVINDAMSMRIKLRGNSTLDAAKKPFKIKFDSKQSLFGLQKAKDWVLLANYYDKSNVRNYLAYLTANKMTNLDFQPSSIFVDVYFNNEYYGLFLLTEQMEAKTGRVDIENNVSNDGINSFLIEADERAKTEYEGYEGKAYIHAGNYDNGFYDFALKSPDADDYVDALKDLQSEDINKRNEAEIILNQFNKDTAWLQNFLDDTSDAIYSSDYTQFSKYVDVDSLIDYYLIQEMFKNVDVGSTSQFYVIDQSKEKVKLAAGPVWDFDIAAGVVDHTSPSTIYNNYSSTPLFTKKRDYFYNAMFLDDTFNQMVCNRYTQVRDEAFEAILDELEIVMNALEKAQARNIEKWPLQSGRHTWIEQNAMSEDYYLLSSTKQHYELLENILIERLAIMDQAYLNNQQ